VPARARRFIEKLIVFFAVGRAAHTSKSFFLVEQNIKKNNTRRKGKKEGKK